MKKAPVKTLYLLTVAAYCFPVVVFGSKVLAIALAVPFYIIARRLYEIETEQAQG